MKRLFLLSSVLTEKWNKILFVALILTLCQGVSAQRPIVEKDIAANPQIKGQVNTLLQSVDGFNPKGAYTMELRARTSPNSKSKIDLYGISGADECFEIAALDSCFAYMNPSLIPYPTVLHQRSNCHSQNVFRLAVAGNDTAYAYRNGIFCGAFSIKGAAFPPALIKGTDTKIRNLIKNGDFENNDYTLQTIKEEKGNTCLNTLYGWNIYPSDVWNSRAFIDKTANGHELRIQRYAWNASGQWSDAFAIQTVDVVPNSVYTLSLKAKGGVHEGVSYGYYRWEEVGNKMKGATVKVTSADNYQCDTLKIKTSETCKQIRIIFGLTSPGGIGEWGGVPEVPMYVDDVVLSGVSPVFYDKALGYNSTDDANVDYLAYDLTGAYAPVMADITTDKNELSISGDKGETSTTISVTGKGLQNGEEITFSVPKNVIVIPNVLPYNASNKMVKVYYVGTKQLVKDSLYLQCGETVRAVPLTLKGVPLKKMSIEKEALSKGEKKYAVDNLTKENNYTMEIKAKVGNEPDNGIKIYSSLGNGKGFCVYIGDSIISLDNPKSASSNPLPIMYRKNSDIMHTFRVSVSSDNLIYVYRDGCIVDTLNATDCVVPSAYTNGSKDDGNVNLLNNSDFGGEFINQFMSDDPDKNMFAHYIEGWDIYPCDGWNTRQYITNWEVDESKELGKMNKALKLQRYGWNKGWSDGLISQAVNVVGGKRYSFKAFAKGGIYDNVSYGYIRLEEVQNTSLGATVIINSDDPKNYIVNYTPSTKCKQLRAVIGLKSPGAIGLWGAVPEVPIYVDNVSLTGPAVTGSSKLGYETDNSTDVAYFSYDGTGAFVPLSPEIITSEDTLVIDGTGKSSVLKITGENLTNGENIRLTCNNGISISTNELPYSAVNKPIVVRSLSYLKRYNGRIVLTSGNTSKIVHVMCSGTAIEQKDLSEAPLYKGNDDKWVVNKENGFTPSEKGYTVEYKVKNSLLNSYLKWYGVEASGKGTYQYVDGKSLSVYNGADLTSYKKIDNSDGVHTYRYAVTPDNHVFIYRDGVPMDTLRVNDYALPAGFASGNGDQSNNLLKNAGFEESYSNYVMADDPAKEVYVGYIEGWTIMDPTDGWNARSYVENMKISDDYGETNHVASLERYLWEDGYADGSLSQIVSVVPGTTYTLTAVAKGGIKSDGTKLAYIKIEEVNATSKSVSVTVNSENFKTYSLSYTPSGNCEQIRVVLGLQKAGKGNKATRAYFDNVKLVGQTRTFLQQLGFVKANAALDYFTYDNTGAYAPTMPKFIVSDKSLAFSKTLDEKEITISTTDVSDKVSMINIVPPSGFMVEPNTIPVNMSNQKVLVTFVGFGDRAGELKIKAGDFFETIDVSGKASPLEEKEISSSPVYTSSDGQYSAIGLDKFNPGKMGYTLEFKGNFEKGSTSSFEIGASDKNEHSVTLTVTDEFTATSYDKGSVDFIGDGEQPNVGDFTYRVAVTPDAHAVIYKNTIPLDTLNLTDFPVNDAFVKSGESVESDNLIKNPNFNKYYTYTKYTEANMLSYLESWILSGMDEWNARSYLEGDPDTEGNKVFTVERYNWNAGWADGRISQVVNVCPNTKYILSASVKGGSENNYNLAYMGYEEVGSSTTNSMNVSSSGDYKTKSLTFTTGPNCSQVKISFWLIASGVKSNGPKCKYYVKNVSLTGKKPVFVPGLYFKSDGDYKFNYLTYDLSGAYAPVPDLTSVNDLKMDGGEKIVVYRNDGGVYLKNVPAKSIVRIYDQSGRLVTQLNNYVDGSPIFFNGRGVCILKVISEKLTQTIKILN